MNLYAFLSLYFTFTLAFRKRVFNFLPLVNVYLNDCLEIKDLRIHSFNGRTYYGLAACFQCPKPLDSIEKELLVRELRAALTLSRFQIALPKHIVVDVQSCDEFVNYIHFLEAPECICGEPMTGSSTSDKIRENNGNDTVLLYLDSRRLTDELKYLLGLLNKMRLLRRGEDIFRRFLRAVEIFSSAVSQADYVVYVFLLATAVEVLASTVKAFIESSQAEPRIDAKDVRNSIAKQYGLYIECSGHRYGLINLRNAVAHGKAGNLDSILAEKILYETSRDIEHVLAPRIRKMLREFLEDPKEFANKITTI